jgi:hypothetical protein
VPWLQPDRHHQTMPKECDDPDSPLVDHKDRTARTALLGHDHRRALAEDEAGVQPSKAPQVRDLTAEEAERVRIGLHAVAAGMVDCGGSPEPTYTAVVEDRTGTRRAVTVVDSECETVIRSDEGYGLGLAWLDR